jgi:hypothetical protein
MNKLLSAVGAILLVILVAFMPACTLGQPAHLEGNVIILPETAPGATPVLAYSACHVMVFETQSGQLAYVVSVNENGYYATEIRPGFYLVDIYRLGSEGSALGMPKMVELKSGETLSVDIIIDTSAR